MEVITIETEAFKRLEHMFVESLERSEKLLSDSQQTIKLQAEIITASKIGLMSAKQVAEITGYDEKTIRLRKEEIGYSTLGKDLKFKPSDVDAWIQKNYRAPKNKRANR